MSKQIKAFEIALSHIEVSIKEVSPNAYGSESVRQRYNNLVDAKNVLEAFLNALFVTQ